MQPVVTVWPPLTCDSACDAEVPPIRVGRKTDQTPVPLRLASDGEWVRIVAVNGAKGFHDRLAGMGLRIGGRLEVIQNRFNGKLLIGHEGTRLFLGGGMAQKIDVVIEGRCS